MKRSPLTGKTYRHVLGSQTGSPPSFLRRVPRKGAALEVPRAVARQALSGTSRLLPDGDQPLSPGFSSIELQTMAPKLLELRGMTWSAMI